MTHPWPLFDLRLRTPDLELRLPTDDDLRALLEVARAGIHDPAATVFSVQWHELPEPARERQFLLHHWQERGSWKPGEWSLTLGVFHHQHIIGVQTLRATNFARTQTVHTGSWLGQVNHGKGFGTQMRAAVLSLAFEGLSALAAESAYLEGNAASARVSQKLGYQPNGVSLLAPRGEPVTEHRVWATHDTWARELVPVEIDGLEPCLGLFGAVPLAESEWRVL